MGTDTGVSKTVVCSALVLAFREKGIDAGYMKPVAPWCSAKEMERLVEITREAIAMVTEKGRR